MMGAMIKIAMAFGRNPVKGGIPPRDRKSIWRYIIAWGDIALNLFILIIEEEYSDFMEMKIGVEIII